MTANFDQFIDWERTTRDTIDFKTIYVDMTDDLIAGLLLSQIVYWHLPNRDGKSKLRVQHEGHMWLAKNRSDWWDEIRITDRQADRALKILEDKELIIRKNSLFAGKKTPFIRINPEGFMKAWDAASRECKTGFTQNVKSPPDNLTQSVKPITEITLSENTTHEGAGEKETPRDYLADVVSFAKKEKGKSNDRPAGYRDATEVEYRVCERVALLWTDKRLPGFARDIENALAGANYLLGLHDGDLRATLLTLDRLHADGVTDGINVASPYSLRNIVPNYLATGLSRKSGDRSYEVIRDGKKVTVIT